MTQLDRRTFLLGAAAMPVATKLAAVEGLVTIPAPTANTPLTIEKMRYVISKLKAHAIEQQAARLEIERRWSKIIGDWTRHPNIIPYLDIGAPA